VAELYPAQISGGQQQRVALARMLVSDPKILLLDEPFSALDSHLKWSMEREIAAVLAEFKGTTVFVSHDRDEAYRISDRIAVMSGGKIELIGAKEDIFNSPKTLAAAKIIGCKNISQAAKLGSNLVKAIDWGITLKTAQPVPDTVSHACVHADGFELANTAALDNSFSCRVHKIFDEPSNRLVEFTFEDGVANGKKLLLQVPKGLWKNQPGSSFIVGVPCDKVICLE
jgi:molybdate transport system ATP-binding protein